MLSNGVTISFLKKLCPSLIVDEVDEIPEKPKKKSNVSITRPNVNITSPNVGESRVDKKESRVEESKEDINTNPSGPPKDQADPIPPKGEGLTYEEKRAKAVAEDTSSPFRKEEETGIFKAPPPSQKITMANYSATELKDILKKRATIVIDYFIDQPSLARHDKNSGVYIKNIDQSIAKATGSTNGLRDYLLKGVSYVKKIVDRFEEYQKLAKELSEDPQYVLDNTF